MKFNQVNNEERLVTANIIAVSGFGILAHTWNSVFFWAVRW